AAFTDPASAVRAALAIPPELAASETTRGLLPRLRVAVHRGPAMATTVNDHLDYFGQTVHEALQTLSLTPAGAFVLSRPVASDPPAAAHLAALGCAGAVLPGAPSGLPFGPLLRLDLDPRPVPPARAGPERVEAPSGEGTRTLLLPSR